MYASRFIVNQDILAKLKDGDIITYDIIQEVIGYSLRKIINEFNHNCNAEIKICISKEDEEIKEV